MGSQVTLGVENPPANEGDARDESSIPGGWEDPLEKEMATHSSILAWRIPCTEKCHELQFKGFIKNQIQFSD